jgi:hypothetical protein
MLQQAIKGDYRSLVKIMEIAQKFSLLAKSPNQPGKISEIQITIVDPQASDVPLRQDEYLARSNSPSKAETSDQSA